MSPLDLLRENTELKEKIAALEIEAAQKNEALQWYATAWKYEEGDDARAAIKAKAALGKPSQWLENHDRNLLALAADLIRENIEKVIKEQHSALEKLYDAQPK